MVIEGIEYKVMVMLRKENGELFNDFLFDDFDDFNRFVNDPKREEISTGCQSFFSLVEVGSNGEPDRPGWEYSFALEEVSREKAEKIITKFIEFNEDLQDTFHLDEPDEFDEDDWFFEVNKQRHMQDVVYVCPHCFRPIEECICAKDPKILIQIDQMMMDVLQLLNDKGYHTRISCAGHLYDPELSDNGVYIAFYENHDFNVPFPQGSVYFKGSHMLRIRPENLDDPKQWQKDTIEQLRKWAQALEQKPKTY